MRRVATANEGSTGFLHLRLCVHQFPVTVRTPNAFMAILKLRSALFSLLALVPTAQAQMMGATMEAEWDYPDFGTVLELHSVVVTTEVELPSTTILSDDNYDIDMGDDWIEFRFNQPTYCYHKPFNGWLFRDAVDNLPPITNYSLDSFSAGITNTAAIVTGFNENEFWANFAGVSAAGAGDWIRLKLETQRVGTPYCLGDGTGALCPCSNDNDGSLPEAGCANGQHASGARLMGSGTASLAADTLVLHGRNTENNQFGLFFQADNDLSPGIVWGDGLRCAGGALRHLGTVMSDGTGYSDTSGYGYTISARAGNINGGDTKYYQLWYRNPLGSPCVSDFNATNGLAVVWSP